MRQGKWVKSYIFDKFFSLFGKFGKTPLQCIWKSLRSVTLFEWCLSINWKWERLLVSFKIFFLFSKYYFRCDCYSGFEGDQCNEKIDQCKGNPCPKDAVMCIDSITRPHCICPTGKLYREDKHTCGIDDLCHKKRPCKNDGICIPSPGGYKCQCPFGWKGKNCTERVNPCDGENIINQTKTKF